MRNVAQQQIVTGLESMVNRCDDAAMSELLTLVRTFAPKVRPKVSACLPQISALTILFDSTTYVRFPQKQVPDPTCT